MISSTLGAGRARHRAVTTAFDGDRADFEGIGPYFGDIEPLELPREQNRISGRRRG